MTGSVAGIEWHATCSYLVNDILQELVVVTSHASSRQMGTATRKSDTRTLLCEMPLRRPCDMEMLEKHS